MRSQLELKHTQTGAGLIEVLVALLIMGIGVLGFMAMQLQALRSSDESFYRTQATVIAAEVAAHMTLNSRKPVFINTAESEDTKKKGSDIRAEVFKIYIKEWEVLENAPSSKDHINPENTCSKGYEDCQVGLAEWDLNNSKWNAQTLLPNGKVQVNEQGNDGFAIVVAWNDTEINECDLSKSDKSDCIKLEVVP
ncbi:MAG TPA: type IV pilus modification protein PilV [Alcanivoracaceae bacterium]|nr:type IV pilus modification protein PilV [Alcanivoracaceae bacterium]